MVLRSRDIRVPYEVVLEGISRGGSVFGLLKSGLLDKAMWRGDGARVFFSFRGHGPVPGVLEAFVMEPLFEGAVRFFLAQQEALRGALGKKLEEERAAFADLDNPLLAGGIWDCVGVKSVTFYPLGDGGLRFDMEIPFPWDGEHSPWLAMFCNGELVQLGPA